MSNPMWAIFWQFCILFRIYELYFRLKAKSEIQILKELNCIVLQTLNSWVSNWNVALHCCRPVFLLGKHDLCGAYHIVYVHKYQLGCWVSIFWLRFQAWNFTNHQLTSDALKFEPYSVVHYCCVWFDF